MRLDVGRRATRQIERIGRRWRTHAYADPDLFENELLDAFDRIKATPIVGQVYAQRQRHTIRRLLLTKSLYHVYYRQESDDVIIVVCVWSVQRSRGPKL